MQPGDVRVGAPISQLGGRGEDLLGGLREGTFSAKARDAVANETPERSATSANRGGHQGRLTMAGSRSMHRTIPGSHPCPRQGRPRKTRARRGRIRGC